MAKMIHSMIRVKDEARSLEFYDKAFGLKVADKLDFDDFALIYLANDETSFELELTVNKGEPKDYDLGDGYGHLAVSVEAAELEPLHHKLTELGHQPRSIVEFQPGGEVVAKFFFVADPDGYQIEVLARTGRFAKL
ncbi:VOC family protein [Limimaricola hongkongensis]|uniref:Aldoketomutase n=1 Tax=Limimaricola hongkongensis DSM 17492 TaxID=1122180 RepID=A0A017HDW0_9RHOB|nr:VOC family protein [Limimaricola hongkongensis]EYD71974.1 Lactoylglutathione lyase [Limimaricola hongkongensis DSM 17492]